jgi:LysR family transcriptional activator of glutamate synthase operon
VGDLGLIPPGDGKSRIPPGRRATFPDELIRVGASIRELVNAGLGVALVAQSVADAPGPPVGVHQPQPAEAHPPIALIRRIAG